MRKGGGRRKSAVVSQEKKEGEKDCRPKRRRWSCVAGVGRWASRLAKSMEAWRAGPPAPRCGVTRWSSLAASTDVASPSRQVKCPWIDG